MDKTPAAKAKVEYLATSSLIPYARNSRTHSEAQVAQIAASIREFSFTSPVLIDKDNTIVAGHGRVLAAQKLGLDTVPCIRLAHLTPSQVRAYVIADNRLTENATWDQAMLAEELHALREIDFDLSLTGFDGEAIERFLTGDAEESATVPSTNAKEIDVDGIELAHRCPRCGFEFERAVSK